MVCPKIGAEMEDLNFEQRWLVVDVACEAELNQWDGVHQVCDPHRAATFMRGRGPRYRWEFRLLPEETAADFSTIATLHPLVRPWTGDIAADKLEIIRIAEYTFRAQLADRWRRGNVFLLGDAVHLMPPFIGQGMGAGIRDAMNLSWKLAGVINGWLPESALATYEQERKPHVRQLIRFALTVGRAMTAGGKMGNLLRRALLPRLHLIPGARGKIADSTTPALHRSALVLKPRRLRGLAGSLCPNPVLEEGKRFDDVAGSGFAVVTSAPLGHHVRKDAARRGAVVVTAEPGTELGQWLRSARVTSAVVRPDRTVMSAGRDTDEICSAVPIFKASVDA